MLFRSTVVSQAPFASTKYISAIGISPISDSTRIVGLQTGAVYRTVTASTSLTLMTGMPANYVARIVCDPVNRDVAYVCFGGFGLASGYHIWKTSNLTATTPTWSASGSGLPDVPVNAMAIDPTNNQRLFAGTDVGVYTSLDGGATWSPFTTGMPIVSVFDMAIQAPNRILRVATHGRGMFERLLDAPVATGVAVTRLTRGERGLVAETSGGQIAARNVVVATGPFQNPIVPRLLPPVDGITQMHAVEYKSPDKLPPGGVLVVGAVCGPSDR